MSEEIKLHDYSIILSEDLDGLVTWLAGESHRQIFTITDENTHRHCLPLLEAACEEAGLTRELNTIVIPEGEEHKNLSTCELIWQRMLEKHVDRHALVLNLGGGVVGDMGGFAASCFKRGVGFANIPTTVLAQVDASIGGKTGVDFNYGKNLIGLFRNPRLVYVSTVFHRTLSDRQYLNGFAEIFKHALIGSRPQWECYKDADDLRSLDQVTLLRDALMVKKQIVEEDPYEGARRKSLNFGHTIGHAIEAWSIAHTDRPLLHGEAIAAGMIAESYLSAVKLGLGDYALKEISRVLMKHYPPVDFPGGTEDLIWQYMQYDKKNIREKVMAALIMAIGEARWDIEISREDLNTAMAYYKNLSK
jgi:3-dehydroquinate synthase